MPMVIRLNPETIGRSMRGGAVFGMRFVRQAVVGRPSLQVGCCVLVLIALAFGLSACTSRTMTTKPLVVSDPLVLPLRVTDSGVGVVVLRSAGGTANLALDTGAPYAIQLPKGSPVLSGLDPIGRDLSADAHGRRTRRHVFEIPECAIGEAPLRTVYAMELNEPLPPMFGADGLLGMDLFSGLVLDIDFQSERLLVLPPGELPPDFAQTEWITVPLVDDRHGFTIEIQLNDHPRVFRAILDSGAVAYGSKTHYAILDLPRELRALADTSSETAVYWADLVRLGNGTIGPVPFLDIALPEPPGQDGFLGNALFVRHRVVIDPSNDTVYISK